MTRIHDRRVLLAISSAALISAIVAALIWPRPVLSAYLAAMVLLIGLPVGCTAILATYHLTGGRWGVATRPMLDAGAGAMLWAWLLILPVAIGVRWLFPWSSAIAATGHAEHAPWYLNTPFFITRQLLYAAAWAVGGLCLTTRTSRGRPYRPAAAAGWLVLYTFTATLAGLDWIAALQPGWTSSIIGMYMVVGQTLTAIAAVAAVAAWRLREAPPGSAEVLHDLGNLLLTALVLHAYMAFSQYFIIWNGNLPKDISWYIPRVAGMWGVIGGLLILVHFGIPFVALLFRDMKRRPNRLLAVALFVLAARVLEVAWTILPSEGQGWPGLVVMIVLIAVGACLASLALGGGWTIGTLPAPEPAP